MRVLAIAQAACLAAMCCFLGGAMQAQPSLPRTFVPGPAANADAQHPSARRTAASPQSNIYNGVILNVFPDLTPRPGESQEGSPSPAQPRPYQLQRPSPHGLPTPRWRRNPLLPHHGKATEV